jgi:ACT domain-containing protein
MELEDVPGQLLKALEPIARFGGNIQSILHQRERKTPLGRVPVTLIFEVGDRTRLNRILGEIKKIGVRITQVGEREGLVRSTVLMVGHIVHADIRHIIDRLNAIDGVSVSDLELSVGAPDQESSARMSIGAESTRQSDRAISKLREIANRKDILLITSIEAVS